MAKVIVYHNYYGCDTGCCGHTIEIEGVKEEFKFEHPWSEGPGIKVGGDLDEKFLQWAKDLVEKTFGIEHVADLDWENCYINGDD